MKHKLLSFLLGGAILTSVAFAQEKKVSGRVTGTNGEGLPGVTIVIQGTNQATQTDANGNYSINVPTGKILVFRSVGYSDKTITVAQGSSLYNIQLSGNESVLDEVVVTGAGLTASRRSIGAAQTTIKAEDLQQAKPTNIVTGLTGKVAGLTVQGVGSGVNPNYRVMLRGMRSLTGNNQALIVIDNVISPSSMLGNLNPDDVEDITVLNGSSAAALYGSQASNGALIIKTKKGAATNGMEVTIDNTTTFENVNFLPEVQKRFGSGYSAHNIFYVPYENQQYGPAFDGSTVQIGDPLEDGSIQTGPYSWNGGKDKFWETGVTNMTNLAVASKHENSSFRFSGQYLKSTGTVPFDKYNRASARVNGTRKLNDILNISYTSYYAQNRYDQTSANANIYDAVLQSPGQVPLTSYKDWQNNPFANPNGYYNAYYNNPYFIAANNRQKIRNDYFMGNVELNFKPLSWLDFMGRVGMTTSNQSYKYTTGKFTFTPYAAGLHGAYKGTNITGSVSDAASYATSIVSDFNAHATHTNGDFKFDYTALFQYVQNQSSNLSATVNGLVVDGIYNQGNSLNPPSTGQADYLARTFGLAGKIDVAYKNYLFLTLTGRNDWVSILDPENRSFFYPGATVSFVATDAIEGLKDFQPLNFLKFRGSLSKVGQVNVGSSSNFGAYATVPTFGQGSGYPYNGIGGHTVGNQIVQPGLKPEMTRSIEFGFESAWWNNRISADVTYFNNKTTDNTVPTGISWATGYSSYLLNAGTTTGKGIESRLTVTPLRTADWNLTLGGNFTYIQNKVVEIAEGLDQLALGTYTGGTGSYAVKGESFPVIMGSTYNRDPEGRIIVDRITGYPTTDGTLKVLGAALPTHTLGLNLSLSYKDLTFYTSAEYRTGNYIFNNGADLFDFSGSGINTVAYDRERFVIPNSSYWDEATKSYVKNTNITVYDGGADYWTMATGRRNIDETYVTSAAFWKIREMSLSYNLPKSFLAGQNVIKRARVSVQGRNLFLWTPATNVYTDPEYSDGNGSSNGNALGLTGLSQTPPSRYVGFSVSLTF
ncbi:SusC/RagA family TonB-linked outer membrane protein [Sphingobacterium paramultivorum]|uniref:SusC/RagA family TonB-linked outer membrane protein n=1 Tax=Sphingobacterium paramultivorum TaxID=2886510 RepID=A0A7G5E4K5_9SPHI|nr:SusC/RagA family TonB-linked outer membrane protein [Sphingobacterium paramultivorum]QMV68930.1 SusC/RagA family TonB-linked outer membrane protein [Sphingobacterium paramultivorum]WSO12706.1 SusC/RagA family TonB-linked outer membrane protein [Sphingobacterium paramultivorum]